MTAEHMSDPENQACRRGGRSGQTVIEFALGFIIFLSLLMGAMTFGWILFVKSTLSQSVQAAVRLAITGPAGGAAGQDAVLKDEIKRFSIGLINDSNEDLVTIEYFAPNCIDDPLTVVNECATTSNAARNIIAIRIDNYDVPIIGGPLLGLDAAGVISLSAIAMDKVEPYPGVAPNRNPL